MVFLHFILLFLEENLDVLLEWLVRIDLSKLYDYFVNQNRTTLEDLQNLREDEIRKVFY